MLTPMQPTRALPVVIELVSSPEASPEMEIGDPAAELTASDDMRLVVHPVNSLMDH